MFEIKSPESCKVALIAGGTSGERTVSLASKEGAQTALEQAGYQVEWFDPADKTDLVRLIEGDHDVAFLALHGKGGEDGTIQGFLEIIGMPYTGSGVFSSALCIDKQKAKTFYEANGVKTPASAYVRDGDPFNAAEIVQELGQKCVVKAATEGSSLGIYIVEGADAVEQAIQEALELDSAVLIEQYIAGTELTVVVLGEGDGATALPIIEIIPRAESYDYDSKYAPGGSEHICPARLSAEDTERIKATAVAAHNALSCQGVSRTDFILDEEGNAWVLETNTLPGMTTTSLLPDAARAAGISFPDLCTQLIESAFKRQSSRKMNTSTK